jgi:hypothetical protein
MEKRAEQVELLERRESCMNSPPCCFFVFRSCGCNISIILILSFVSLDRTRINNNPPLSDRSLKADHIDEFFCWLSVDSSVPIFEDAEDQSAADETDTTKRAFTIERRWLVPCGE